LHHVYQAHEATNNLGLAFPLQDGVGEYTDQLTKQGKTCKAEHGKDKRLTETNQDTACRD
jgi:hypothetical protein